MTLTHCGSSRRLCAKIDKSATAYGENGEYRILAGYSMTDLERELLNAFESLQSTYEQQQQELHSALESLQRMYARILRENKQLDERIRHLSAQLDRLR
ncbi:mbeD/MobD like protein [Salmonella enterica]|nr:mbeD/MobD like protein [Salmonella enterica]